MTSIYDFDYLFKILFVGDQSAGKTSLLLRYTDYGFADNYISTIGVDFKIKYLILDDYRCKLQIWDVPRSCERFRSLSSSYYRGLHGIIFVYDITDLESFDRIKNFWYKEYCKHRLDSRDSQVNYNYGYDYSTYNPQILILGTKSDLRNQSNYKTCVDFNNVREFAQSINALSFEVSSKSNIGIDESIYEMISSLLQNYFKANGKKRNEIDSQKKNFASSSSSSKCIIN